MPKKKTEAPTHDPEVVELVDQQLSEYLEREVKDGEVVETPEETETPEPTPEPTEEETPPTPPEPVVDVEAEKALAAEKAVAEERQATIDRMMEAVSGKKEADLQDDNVFTPWSKEKRQPESWEEVAQFMASYTEEQRSKKDAEAAAQRTKDEEVAAQTLRDQWSSQQNRMISLGLIPAIEKADDPNDPGNQAMAKIYTHIQDQHLKNTPVYDLFEAYESVYGKNHPTKAVPGANAPVGSPAVPTSQGDDSFYYDQLKKDYDELLLSDEA